jgi:hypothetical protein
VQQNGVNNLLQRNLTIRKAGVSCFPSITIEQLHVARQKINNCYNIRVGVQDYQPYRTIQCLGTLLSKSVT